MDLGHFHLRQGASRPRGRRLAVLYGAAALVVVAGLAAAAAVVLSPGSGPRRAVRTPAFVAAELGARRAVTPAVARPRFGTRSEVTPGGLRVRSGAASVSLSSADAGHGAWTSYAGGAVRPTRYGQELVTVGGSGAEQFLQVDRHQGVHTWRWRLGTSLRASLTRDGMVAFRDADGKDTGLRVEPVALLDTHGLSVTPRGLHWSLGRHDGAQFLELRLDDSSLPVPYLIDPSITAVSFAGSSMAAGATSNWTVGFKTSSSGALNAGKTITVVFPSAAPQNFTVPASPTIVLGLGYANCTATATAASTTVTVTLAGASCSVGNSTTTSMTIQGLTNPPQAAAIAKANFTVKTSVDNASAVSPGSNVTIVAGPFSQLQLLMPGESAAAGSASGKTGTPSARTAGTSFNVIVNAVDANWNKVNTVTDTVGLTSSDGQATLPANTALAAGTKTLAVTLKTAGTQTVTASDVTDGTKTSNTSPDTTVNPAAASKLVVLSVPGSATAGVSFSVQVGTIDAYGNTANVTSTTGISLAASGTGTLTGKTGSIVNGTSSVTLASVQYTKAESITLTASRTSGMALTTSAASSSFTVGPAAAATLGLSGTPASVTAGTTGSVTVTAKDAYGNTATGYTGTVTFASSDGAASLPSDYTFTGGDAGVHVFSGAYALKTAGSRTLTATDTVTGTITGTSPSITVNPAAAATLTLSATPASVTAGATGSVTVTAKDAYGNTATGYTGTVAFSSSDGQAALPANYTFIVANAGVHVFSNAYTLKTAGSRTLTATDTVTGTITGTSPSITVNPAVASKLSVVSVPGSATAGVSFSVQVGSVDAYGNAANVTSATGVSLAASGSGVLSGNAGSIANGTSSVTLSAVQYTKAESITLTASRTSGMALAASAASSSFTVAAAGAATLSLGGTPASVTAGSTGSVTVTAKDSFGNVAAGYTGTVAFASSDGAASLPANYTFTGDDAGVHVFSGAYTLKTVGSRTVSATDTVTGTITGTSATITVNPASAATLTLSGTPASVTAGAPGSVTVTAKDAYGNTATGYTGTVAFGSSDGQAALPANYTFTGGDAGAHVFSFAYTLKTSGSRTVTATDTVTGTITGTSGGITVNPAGTATLALGTTPASVTAGSTGSVTVTAKDAYGNTVPGYSGTVTFSSTDGQAALPANYTFTGGDAGAHVFSNAYTLKTAGSNTVTATDTVTGTIKGTSAAITVDPAGAASLVLTGTPASLTAGATGSVTVTAKDAYGNTATGYTGTVTFASSDGAASLPADYTFTGGDAGAHLFTGAYTLKTAGSRTVSATDALTGTITGTSPAITVDPAGAASLVLTGTPASLTAGSTGSVTVTAVDAYGNVVTGFTGTVAFTSNDPQAALPSDYHFTGGDAGAHSFASAYTLRTTGSRTVTATSGGVTGTSPGVIVYSGPATSLVATAPASTTAGAGLGVTVSAEDAYGNIATGYAGTVTLTSTDAHAVLPAAYGFVGADNGSHVLTVTLKSTPSQTVSATDGTLSATTGSISVGPGAAASFVVGGPASVTAGGAASVSVTAEDVYGNVATGYTGTVGLASSDAQAGLPGPHAFTPGDAGTHTFSTTLKTAGAQTVSASDGSIGGTSGSISVDPAALATLAVDAPASATAGAAVSVTVSGADAYGNPTTNYTGTVTLTSSDGQAVLPAPHAYTGGDAGTHVFSVTLKTAGPQTVSASDGSISGSSGPVAVSAAAASSLTLTGAPASATAGTGFSVTVTAWDPYGNVATGYTGTAVFLGTDPQAALPGDFAFGPADAGTHSFPVTLKTAGSQTVSVSDGPLNATSAAIAVGPAAAASFTVDAPASATAGDPGSVTVTAEDAYGNVATGYTGTVSLTSTDAQAVLPAAHAFAPGDAGVHVFPVTLKTAASQTVSASDGSIDGTSGAVAVGPGAVSAATSTTGAAPASVVADGATPVAVTVTLEDAYGNAVPGKSVSVAASGSAAVSPGGVSTDPSGIAAFSVTDTVVESSTFTATDTTDSVIVAQTASASFVAGPLWQIAISPSSSSVAAGASQAYTVTGSDAYGHSLGAQSATFSIAPDGSCADPSASCSATVSGTHTVTANVAGKTDQAALTVGAGAGSGGTTTLTAAQSSIVADGASTTTITVALKDSYGNSLTSGGSVVALSTTGGTLSSVTDNGDGTYSATLVAPVTPGTGTVSGTVDGNPIAATATVTFTNSDVTPPTLLAANATGSTITLTYDEALDAGSTPAPGDFAVLRNLAPDAVTTVSVGGSSVTLTLGDAVVGGDLVTVSYTGSATQDLAANPAATFVGQPALTGPPPAPAAAACPPRFARGADGSCVPPPPPPPPIRFVGSSPADGATLTGIDSISLSASHMATWYAIAVVGPDGETTEIPPGFGVTYSQPFAASLPGAYTLTATMDDGFNPVQHVTARFTVVPDRPDVALPGAAGSVESAGGWATVDWGAGTFTDPVSVAADDSPAVDGLVGAGSRIVRVTVTRLADGLSLTAFGRPLELVLSGVSADGVVAFSEDGKTWTPLPLLASSTLPAGQPDGYFRDPAGAVHVLTTHLTYFGVVTAPKTKLALTVSGTVTRLPGGARQIAVRVGLARSSHIVAGLYSPHGALLRTWTRTVPAGTTTLNLVVPAAGVEKGICTIVLQATAGGQTTRSTIPVSLR